MSNWKHWRLENSEDGLAWLTFDRAQTSTNTFSSEVLNELADVCSKGVLTVSTDPAYPPQSKYDPKTDTYKGFDIDVATEIELRFRTIGRHEATVPHADTAPANAAQRIADDE